MPPFDKAELLARATTAAREAIRAHMAGDSASCFVSAGTSIELLGKAYLAGFHPALIIDSKNLDSLFHACGASSAAKTPVWQLRTIGAAEVVDRCARIMPSLRTHETTLRLLAELRNSVLHLGQAPCDDLGAAFDGFLAGSAILVEGCGALRATFYGDYADLVEAELDRQAADVERETARAVALARDLFNERYGRLGEQEREALFKAIDAAYAAQPAERHEEAYVTCPACSNRARVKGPIEVDWEPEYDEDVISGGYPVVTLFPSSLHCLYCNLALGKAGLLAAGVEEGLTLEGVDPGDFSQESDFW